MEVRNPADARPVSIDQANRVVCRPCQVRLANQPPRKRWAAYLGITRGRRRVALSNRQAPPRPRVGGPHYPPWFMGRSDMPTTPCPTCGQPVYRTHRCPGRTIDPPAPRPPEFWTWVSQARAEALAERHATTVVQDALPLGTDPLPSDP